MTLNLICSFENMRPSHILLATAIVQVKDASGRWQLCRALLSSASRTNFVSFKLIERLRAKTFKKHIPIGGIAQALTEVNKAIILEISSRVTRYNKTLEFLILNNITSELPTAKINNETWNIPKELSLSDPDFNVPCEIDMLFRKEIFLSIMKTKQLQ